MLVRRHSAEKRAPAASHRPKGILANIFNGMYRRRHWRFPAREDLELQGDYSLWNTLNYARTPRNGLENRSVLAEKPPPLDVFDTVLMICDQAKSTVSRGESSAPPVDLRELKELSVSANVSLTIPLGLTTERLMSGSSHDGE